MLTKPSRFNIRSTLPDGTLLLFNFATLALIALDAAGAHKAGRILEDPGRQAQARGHRRLARLLEENGFLVPDREDELAPLEAAFRAQRAQAESLSLTLLPTLACNFDCTYCYERPRHDGRMTREVEEALPPFVAARLPQGGRLVVTWYGGEPLLAPQTIERLSRAFIAVCQDRSARYEARIITNGYLLDGATACWLKQLGVTDAQVTLDGPPVVHDRRRPLARGGGTFARIAENLLPAADVLDIAVRTNVDEDNRTSIGELLDLLVAAGIGHKVRYYTGRTTSSGSPCADGTDRCLGLEDFSIAMLETSLDLAKRGLSDFSRPAAMSGPCGATRGNSFVVTPDGGLVTCWDEVGRPDRLVGHLLPPQTEGMESNRRAWAEYDPFALECRDCSVLPVCMSRCPYQVRENGIRPCPGWKHHPDEHLLNEYRLRQADREKQVAVGLLELRDALCQAFRATEARQESA